MFNLFVSMCCLLIATNDFKEGSNKAGWFGLIVSACNFSVFLFNFF